MKVRFNFKQLGFAFVAFLAVACARTQLPVANSADAERAGVSIAELSQGRELYVARCSSCHLPVEPTEIAPAHWPGHVAEMKERADLDEHEASLVTRYLVTMAQRHADRVSSSR